MQYASIKQNDVEKLEQVPLMREIYANADLTIVWLGEAKNDSDIVTDLMPSLNIILEKVPRRTFPLDTNLLGSDCQGRRLISVLSLSNFWTGLGLNGFGLCKRSSSCKMLSCFTG
jgi:Heterokaryon incompatibility protein (HET)